MYVYILISIDYKEYYNMNILQNIIKQVSLLLHNIINGKILMTMIDPLPIHPYHSYLKSGASSQGIGSGPIRVFFKIFNK